MGGIEYGKIGSSFSFRWRYLISVWENNVNREACQGMRGKREGVAVEGRHSKGGGAWDTVTAKAEVLIRTFSIS